MMRFCLKQASIGLIFLVAPGTALHAQNNAPGSGDYSEVAVFAFGICNLTKDASESVQVFSNGVGIEGNGFLIDESGWLVTSDTGNGFDSSRKSDIHSKESVTEGFAPEEPAFFEDLPEPFNTGWAIVLDNDALVSRSRDEDYTGGIAVALGGSRVTKYRFSLDSTLTWINKKLHLYGGRQRTTLDHLMQFGFVLFTPDIGEQGGPKCRPGPEDG